MSRVLIAVLVCHFLAAFTVLGMPLYLPVLFTDLGLPSNSPWIGFVFAWPTLLTALSGPLWGKVADRFGRRFSLIRALAGLSLAFAWVGVSSSVPELVMALTLQGLMGGTLAAANSYLATTLPRETLSNTLNWTQFSARMALVTAPLVLAFGVQHVKLQHLYIVLATLPMLGALYACTLPNDSHTSHTSKATSGTASNNALGNKSTQVHYASAFAVCSLQALFCFAMVVTFPYFLPYAAPGIASTTAIALLYVLPHLVYLLLQPLLKKRLPNWALNCHLSMLALAMAACMQWQFNSGWALTAARVLFGVGIWLGYHGTHQLVAKSFQAARAGTWFGSLDSVGKLAGVAAGVAAGFAVNHMNLSSPFLLSAVASLAAMPLVHHIQKTGSRPCPHLNNEFSNTKPNTTA
ncbi:MFS transporter [Limnobacter alexandrii]|jgi:MFS family permease|uniref:MFS transporter n=1 Tax=Limnobacter alexandrii TaxID=2570352 RepID=UPI001486D4C9|nr:MFS transporter [Limnobacter alexandrii]